MKTLRLAGYKYTSPLLACDTEIEMSSPKMNNLSKKIQEFISKETAEGNIQISSVYIRDYKNGNTININPEEKYYPASLNKIPVMISAFKNMDINSNFLSTKHKYNDYNNFNETAEILPKDYLRAEKTYSISEAIDKMIINSDNNALYFLYKYIDPKLIDQTFIDLKITQPKENIVPQDYMTVKEFSYFLRVLYNSTYLKNDNSEKALGILTKSQYINGIVAGLPKDIQVAHKFGIRTYKDNGKDMRELHDCGIVYTDKPYLICVMTKNNNTLISSENVIKTISSMTYESLR